jgi:D-psicose/D-tagatose/L-ribulose 3-epimerase
LWGASAAAIPTVVNVGDCFGPEDGPRHDNSIRSGVKQSSLGGNPVNQRLRLGVCTWTFGDLPLNEIARRLQTLGFDGVELAGDLALYQAREAGQILRDHGLKTLSLTPDNVDVVHPDAAVRSEAVDYYLRLLDFAADLGNPIVSCHGYVGRVRAIDSYAEEWNLFLQSVRMIALRAMALDLRLVIEVLNRYEAHLVNTAAEALDFVTEVGAENVGVLLDAYHMNIEESDPAAALRLVRDRLWLYHVADSNRQGIGHGHTAFDAQLATLADIGYDGPIILECTAPGPDPFAAIKDGHSVTWLETYLRESRSWLLGAMGSGA